MTVLNLGSSMSAIIDATGTKPTETPMPII